MWQERYLKLTNYGMYYYKKHTSEMEQGLIPINMIATIICDEANLKKKKFRFDIRLGEKFSGRVFSFLAQTEAECRMWVDKLRTVHGDYQDSMAPYHADDVVGESESVEVSII